MDEDYNSQIENQENENTIQIQSENKTKITSPTIKNPMSNSNNTNNNRESIIWDLETWKKAEQIKFKAYLKQLEYDFINKLTDQFKLKEEERDREIKSKISEINTLQTRLKKKATELESRENKIILTEEELKIKINEVARQLTHKDEEIAYIKKRFREEKLLIEKDSVNLNKIISEKIKEIEKIESAYKNFKKEIDDSPISLLKAEITRKSLEIDDHVREKERINHEKDRLKSQCEKLKLDILKIKKLFEQEKEIMYKTKLDEIEKLKFEIYNQRVSNSEISELQELRNQIKLMKAEETKGNLNPEGKNEKEEKIEKKKEYKIINLRKNNYSQGRNYNNENGYKNEIEKLENEKYFLLNSGTYSENDPLIIRLENKLKKLYESGLD